MAAPPPAAAAANAGPFMQIKVLTLIGKEVGITVQPSWTIHKIQEKIEETEGIPPSQQRLIFAGKAMNETQTVDSYGLKAGDVVHLVLAL
eukprot:gnl/Spiro4/17781_TR9456_c0_g1_i1.p1 gnl/Spiro4/17781_TR9456_c0_g1~~gnl/Spiro4/17781_TR9456_c0_g1_i1.p1  ORF type:complete len:105 (-),score=28.99 gnl/Spiro4/17781_TR9456_c0_g1_i1:113-382(-)